MDFDNKQSGREYWREERRKWKEAKQKWKNERREYYGHMGMYTGDSGNNSSGRIWTGIFLLVIGVLFLLRTGDYGIPGWVYTWPMLLVGLGFFLGVRHNFRGGFWFVMMLVGGVFLVQEISPDVKMKPYIWPMVLIILGLFFIFKPRRRWQGKDAEDEPQRITDTNSNIGASKETVNSGEDIVDTTSIFGGIKRNVLSKNFKGGDIVNIMGGSEIDLTQADITGTVRLELTQVFGGTKLVVPSNWQVKTEMAAIFGGVEDKRSVRDTTQDPNKVLILAGTSIFGGIDIRSY